MRVEYMYRIVYTTKSLAGGAKEGGGEEERNGEKRASSKNLS